MSNHVAHTYHLVDMSPWPLLSAGAAFSLTNGLVSFLAFSAPHLMLLSLLNLVLIMWQWWRDISSEGALQGLHTNIVETGLRWGVALFIISEVFFFLSFFWAFFHSSLATAVNLGGAWPPAGIQPFNPWGVPLLNTLILLSSGVSVTWAHHAMMAGAHSESLIGLVVTVTLGLYFTALQGYEYYEAPFSFAEGVYGAVFFMATGFHGIHVLVGSSFLVVSTWRTAKGLVSPAHHFGIEAAIWYWHFVDVVWLFLFLSIYVWGGLN